MVEALPHRFVTLEHHLLDQQHVDRARAFAQKLKHLAHVALFARNLGRTLSRADILDHVWGMDVAVTERTVDNFIVRFRKLFEPEPEKPVHFITVRGVGYRCQL